MIIEQLTNIYYEKENWHKDKLSKEDANKYHERLLMQGNILTVVKDNELKGYIEVWCINYEQLGRIMCGIPIYAFQENITDGEIAYVTNGWVDNDKVVSKQLMRKFIDRFKSCRFVARKRFKYNDAFKVYPIGYLGA